MSTCLPCVLLMQTQNLMHKLLRYLLLTATLAAMTGYAFWTQERPVGLYLSDLRSELSLDQGSNNDKGNLLGIQPELFAGDYQSPERLKLKLAAYLDNARNLGLINSKTVVVLPEHIGTWLVANGEKPETYQATTLNEAMTWVAVSNPLKLLRALFNAQGEDRLTDALFRMKAPYMAATYQDLFGGLAKRYGVTLVAGSIVLPEPRVENGQLIAGDGPLYNVSQTFASDGSPLGQPQRKVIPIIDEQGFTASAQPSELQVLDTPAGRLGVLVCADSWFPENYAALAPQQPKLLAVPAFLTGNGNWDKPWGGYNGAATPADVTRKAGELSEGEAWQEMAMPGRLSQAGASAGITVYMRGQLWDLGSDGNSMLATVQQHQLTKPGSGARLINLWL